MVEELKLAIKIDDASIEQSLLKQFANAQKMADKVVLDFRNVNFDDKQIEAKFKEMQKKAGQNPIDLTISDNALDMLGQIDKRLTEIFSIGKGKSFIDSSSITADIGKIENKINELNKKYEESQKKLSSIGSGGISGKDVNLVDNAEFKKLSQEVSELKNQFDDLKTHMQLLDDYTVPTDRFFELQSQVEATTVKVSDLVEEFTKLSNAQKALSFIPQESNISLASDSEIKTTTNDIIEEQKAIGELQIAFRGLEGSLNGFMSNSGRLATFFTTSPLLARQYADSLGGVYQAMVALGNSLNINAEGRDWNAVEYLGNGSDEASKKIIELRKQIDSLYEQLNASDVSGTGLDGRAEQIRGDFSHIIQFYGDAGIEYNSYIEAVEKGNIIENQENETVKNLMVQLYNLEKAYKAISDAKNNVYGTHTTDEFAELAKANGYDSVMFRNIKDSFDRTKNLTDVGAIFDENQVANVKNVSDQIDNLVSRIDGVKSQHGLNLPINIELPKEISKLEDGSFVNNLTGEIYSNVQTAIESLKELETQAIETEKAIENTSSKTQKKDAFPSTEATASVEKTTQAIREENNALDETVSKAKQAASELTKTRDIVSQNWYREKGTVVGKDSKGNDITRDADEFSFVERLKNGQLQTVLATYDEETGKWAEQVINVRTAFEQVEKAIISADNKIASLEIAKERTLASHPGYDATADDNQIAIERKKRDELQATLNLYGSEKEYVFEIEVATKRIADNQKRLNNKKQSQTNLRQAVSDEKDAKANEQANKRDAKQAQIEAENIKLAEQKSIYNELIDSIDRYSTVSKRIESGKAFEGDYEEAARLQEKIEELQNNPILSQEQLDASQRKLEKIETTLEDIATAKAKSDSIKVDSENVKNIQTEWDKNIKAIQDYMDAMTKLNNLKAKDKGTGSEANQIALQTQNVEELKQAAWDARKNLSSIQAENPDIIAWKQWVDMMKLFDQASKGSAESAAKLKDVLDNIKAPSLDKYENKLASYQTKKGAYNATIARFNDGGWTSDEYLKNVQAVKDAVNEYETLLNELKGKDASLVTSDDISKLDEYEKKIKDTIATVTNMSAAEKGYNFVSGQKELDKIHKLLNENSKMSSEAKAKIRAYYTEIESGNPSMSLDRIHGEIMKIYNAEVEAGRAGRSFFDTLKNSGFHKLAAQMSGMFGFYDVINIGKQAISTIVSLDDALLDLKKTTSMSSTELNNFYYSANDVAKQMGVTTKSIIEQASAWSRLGYSSNEQATEMAKLSSKFASISPGMDTDQAQEGMVSIMKAWQINPEDVEKEILDPINQLGNKFAESNNDIVEGMKRSAAALAAVGTDYKDAYSLFTGVQEVLQNSEVAGRALRSISMRIRGYDENSEDGFEQTDDELKNITGDLIDLTKTAQHAQGVSIFKEGSTTEFKSLVDYFGEIHDIWDEMSQKQQNDFLQKAFGKTQAQAGAALIQNYDAVKEALAEIDKSAGSADKEMSTVEQTLSYKINALKETWVGCAQQILDRGDLGIAISGLNGVSKVITGLIDNVGLLKTAAMGVAAALSFKNVGIDTLVAY